MKIFRSLAVFAALLFMSLPVLAQQDVEMADEMRKNGKIYVVVAVMLTILIGLILYLVRLDRKISRMERAGKS